MILITRTADPEWLDTMPTEPAPLGVVERHRRPLTERIYGALLATVIGVCLAAALVHWWAS